MLSITSQVSERKHCRVKLQRQSGCCSILWHMARLKVILQTYVVSATQVWHGIPVQHVPFTALGELPLAKNHTSPSCFLLETPHLMVLTLKDKSSGSPPVGQRTFRVIKPGRAQSIPWAQSLSEELGFRKYNSLLYCRITHSWNIFSFEKMQTLCTVSHRVNTSTKNPKEHENVWVLVKRVKCLISTDLSLTHGQVLYCLFNLIPNCMAGTKQGKG